MADTMEIKTAAPKRQKQGRSPAYPGIDLEKALAKAKALYDAEGKYAAPMPSAFNAWGFSPKSSGGREVRAALKYFGLITVDGDNETGKVKLTEDALRVLLDEREDQTEKKAIIRRLALNPAVHQVIYKEFPDGIKSDASAEHYLVFEQGYNKSAAADLVAEFKATAAFTALWEPESKLDKKGGVSHSHSDDDAPPAIKIGDKIQWTSQGAEQFANGGTVLGLSEDGQWVFTDQGKGAVPISEVAIMEHAPSTHQHGGTPPPTPPHILAAIEAAKAKEDQASTGTGTRKAVFPVEDGDVTLIFPENITSAGLEELGQYLNIFLKKEQKKTGAG